MECRNKREIHLRALGLEVRHGKEKLLRGENIWTGREKEGGKNLAERVAKNEGTVGGEPRRVPANCKSGYLQIQLNNLKKEARSKKNQGVIGGNSLLRKKPHGRAHDEREDREIGVELEANPHASAQRQYPDR